MPVPRVLLLALVLTAALVALAVWGAGAGGDRQAERANPERGIDRTIEITARQFAYEPATIRVGLGERVRLVLTTADVAHSLAVREYGINLIVTPGEAAAAVFTADRPGRFLIYCTVYCGTGHPDHVGTLIVDAGEEGDLP